MKECCRVAGVACLLLVGFLLPPLSAEPLELTPGEIRSWLASSTEETVYRLTRVLRDAQSSPLPVKPRVIEEALFGLSACPVRVPEELDVLKQIRFMIEHPEAAIRHAALRALVLRYRSWKAAREVVQGLDVALVGEELYRWACDEMHISGQKSAAAQERLELILRDARRQWEVMRWMPPREARRRLEDWLRFQPGVRRGDIASETLEVETTDGQTGSLLLLPK